MQNNSRIHKNSISNLSRSTDKNLETWKAKTMPLGFQETEFLLPRLVVKHNQGPFPFMQKKLLCSDAEFKDGLKELSPWTYHIKSNSIENRELGNFNEKTIEFHQFRRCLISEIAEVLFRENKEKSTVLDLACNCGVFSLDFANLGFGRVKGIDVRTENILQANFLKNSFGIENTEFETKNIKNISYEPYDIVLLLGIMYHLSTPFEILRSAYELTKKVCFVDTITHKEPVSAFIVQAKDTSISIEGDENFELQPTYRGIIDTIRLAGFNDIIEVVSDQAPTAELYNDFSRRCFMCIKDKCLASDTLKLCI